VTQYKITSAITNGTELTVNAKCCEQIGTRKSEYKDDIPIIRCRNDTVVILIADLPKTDKLGYIKTQIETAYEALPDETLVKLLIGKTWST
jgi:uncharacterized protein YlzI (FlbEa/FlbD family)